jgi:mRNA-degrading endonuclease toxin of MazEF toxin-antitoxin module
MADRTIQRGDIWIADLGYAGKIRPVLIVSMPPTDRERALHIVWLTRQRSGTRNTKLRFLIQPFKPVHSTLSRFFCSRR